jgi:predicted phosphodiesterase
LARLRAEGREARNGRRLKIAALYDIHGNLPALEAVVAELRQAGVDQVVVGGDVLPGPMCRDCLTLLRRLEWPVQFIMGNGDEASLDERAGKPGCAPAAFRESIRWCGEQLTDEEARFAGRWPMTLRIGDVLFCHATPRDLKEIFTARTDEAKLRPVFEPANASTVVCGHTHMQFDRAVGATRVLNAGSVGMPFGAPGAYWLLLGDSIELRRTEYDLAAAAARILESRYPLAGEFADRNVLDPPSAEFILDSYAKNELTV